MSAARPLVGITAGTTQVPIVEGSLLSTYAGRGYSEQVASAGGAPVLLPAPGPEDDADAVAHRYLDALAAVVLSGGVDLHPRTYGAEWEPVQPPDPDRDRFEVAMARAAVERGVPVLGICRGMQVLNVAFGGDLHEHIEHEDVAALDEGGFAGVRRHEIGLVPDTRTRAMLGRDRVGVFCLHHQAPDRIGSGLIVSGRADDGIVEAIEVDSDSFAVGVLWHPEQMSDAADLRALPFEALLAAAGAGVGA